MRDNDGDVVLELNSALVSSNPLNPYAAPLPVSFFKISQRKLFIYMSTKIIHSLPQDFVVT